MEQGLTTREVPPVIYPLFGWFKDKSPPVRNHLSMKKLIND
jgi:hypothetical protein